MTESNRVTSRKIKLIETEKILTSLHYKKHHLQVNFNPALNAFRVWLVWDDTNEPHANSVGTVCPYNMTKTAAEYLIRYLYWYQTNIAEIDLHRKYIVEERYIINDILSASAVARRMANQKINYSKEKNNE